MKTPQLADALRAAALQAAIKGELTARSSENARDLLAQIQNEKQALQAKGSLKKTKAPAPVTADEVPFDIPENWVWVRLGDVTDYGIGKQTPSEKIPAGSLIVEMEDIEKETYRLLDKNRERTPKSSKNSFVAGDVLYGKLRPYLKKVVVADESGFCSTEIIPFNGFGKINPQYLMFCMTSPFMLSSVNQLTYGMDMPRLGTNDAKNLLIPLPPLAEQQAIAEKLTRLLAEIDRLKAEEQSLASLQKAYPQTLRASVLAAAIKGELTERSSENARDLLLRIQNEKQALQAKGSLKKTKAPAPVTADEVPFDIPENWVWVRVGEIFEISSSKRVHQQDWKMSGIPFYRAREIAKLADYGEVQNELFISDDLYSKLTAITPPPQAGDFMVSGVGTLGKTYIVREGDVFYYKDASVLHVRNRYKITPQFFKYYMESDALMNQVRANSSGTTVATLTIERFNNYLIPLPPFVEQQAIVEKLSALLAEIDALDNA